MFLWVGIRNHGNRQDQSPIPAVNPQGMVRPTNRLGRGKPALEDNRGRRQHQ